MLIQSHASGECRSVQSRVFVQACDSLVAQVHDGCLSHQKHGDGAPAAAVHGRGIPGSPACGAGGRQRQALVSKQDTRGDDGEKRPCLWPEHRSISDIVFADCFARTTPTIQWPHAFVQRALCQQGGSGAGALASVSTASFAVGHRAAHPETLQGELADARAEIEALTDALGAIQQRCEQAAAEKVSADWYDYVPSVHCSKHLHG